MTWWPIAALLATLALLSSSGSGGGPPASAPQAGGKLKALQVEVANAGGSRDWEIFLAAVAHHESRWVLASHNDSKNERAASQRAYNRNAEKLAGCHPEGAYTIGSGGWYGFLPANAVVSAFRNTPGICTDPSQIWDPRASTIMALAYANNLRGWSSFRNSDRTWLALNRGWSAPGEMNLPRPKSDAKFLRGLRAQGIPESFAMQKVSGLPSGWNAWDRMTKGASA